MEKLKEVVLHLRQHKVDPTTGKPVLKNNGGYTVLIQKDPKHEGCFMMAVARCGKNDNFNKAIGLAIVRGRVSCRRKELVRHLTHPYVMRELQYLTSKTHSNFKQEFLELLLKKLV